MNKNDPLVPESEPLDNQTAITDWSTAHPVAWRVYWTVRAALEERDGGRRSVHHRIAVMAIHDAFGGKADRVRLRLPATQGELADALGVADRTLRKYRLENPDIFAATRATIRDQFINLYYAPAFEALGEVATDKQHPQFAQSQRTFFTLSGDLVERKDVTSDGERIEAVQIYLPDNQRERADD